MSHAHSDRIASNLQGVLRRIEAAADLAGRAADEIRLIGVSKYVGVEETLSLAQAGCLRLGESRPQQLWEKAAAEYFADLAVEWRLIGHLQRNKVKRTLPYAASIDSVDSRRLLTTINQEATTIGKQQVVLLEVNCSGDPEKHGFLEDDLLAVVEELVEWPNVKVQGLMTMAAREGGPETARENFAQLRRLFDAATDRAPSGVTLSELSMGMSGDFEQAILEGATLVRVGSALWDGLAS